MTANKHGFEPKQEFTMGGIAWTIIQTDEIPPPPEDWRWTATPDSPVNNFVRCVYPYGTLLSHDASYGLFCVRPLCNLKSEILKSYLGDDGQKRREAVDMMKHIAAAWDVKPKEVF